MLKGDPSRQRVTGASPLYTWITSASEKVLLSQKPGLLTSFLETGGFLGVMDECTSRLDLNAIKQMYMHNEIFHDKILCMYSFKQTK